MPNSRILLSLHIIPDPLNILELFPPVRTFVFEVDGVLTDGHMLLGTGDICLRSFSARDMYALDKAMRQGYRAGVVVPGAGGLPSVLRELGLFSADGPEAVPGAGTTLYMGSDLAALDAMQRCMLPCCPADAVAEVKAAARYISPHKGGAGCVRDVIEKVLKLNGHW